MPSLRICCIFAGLVLLSACNGQTTSQIAANGAAAVDETIEDADARAERLAAQSALLNTEAAHATGARRQALRNEASEDMTAAMSVEQEGETDAENIADATAAKVQDSTRR